MNIQNKFIKELIQLYIQFEESLSMNLRLDSSFYERLNKCWFNITKEILTNNASRKRFKRWYELFNESDEEYSENEKEEFIYQYLLKKLSKRSIEDKLNKSDNINNTESQIKTKSVISEFKKRVVKDNENGNYIFFLKSAPKPVVITENDLKLLKERYSNWDGIDSTINEICRDFKIPRPWLVEIKTIMGWTHDSEPFLDDEILSKDEDELVEEALMNRKANIYQKYEIEKWKQVKEEAEKFRNLEYFVVKPIIDKIEQSIKPYDPIKFDTTNNISQNNVWVLPPFDLHIGKMSYPDTNVGICEYREEILKTYSNLIERGKKNSLPKLIYVPCGSDFFHVDTFQATTSKGTPQHGNMVSHIYDMIIDGYKIGIELTDMIVDIGVDVIFFNVAGNHDRLLSLNFLLSLEQRYRNIKYVNIIVNKNLRQYFSYGRNLFAFAHGDEIPFSGGQRTITQQKFLLHEAKKHKLNVNYTSNYFFFTGHVHKAKTEDDDGVYDIVVPSLSKPDYWHYEKGYIGVQRKASLYIFDEEEGLISILYSKPI